MSDAGHGVGKKKDDHGGHGSAHGSKQSIFGKLFGSDVLIGDAGAVLDETGFGGLLYWVATGNKLNKSHHHHHHHHHHEHHGSHAHPQHAEHTLEDLLLARKKYQKDYQVYLKTIELLEKQEGGVDTKEYHEADALFQNIAHSLEDANWQISQKLLSMEGEALDAINTLESALDENKSFVAGKKQEIIALTNAFEKNPALKNENAKKIALLKKEMRTKMVESHHVENEHFEKIEKLEMVQKLIAEEKHTKDVTGEIRVSKTTSSKIGGHH